MKVYRTQVQFGLLNLEVLMDDNKNLYFTAPSLNQKLSFAAQPTDAVRSLKRLRVEGLEPSQFTLSEKEGGVVYGYKLDLLPNVIKAFVLKGNKVATEVALDLMGLALTQIAYDAFGVKFETQEREAYMEKRLASKKARRTFTDVVKEHGELHGYTPNYGKLTSIFYGITKLHKGRDSYTKEELARCEFGETFVGIKVDNGEHPERALKLLKELLR